VPLACPKLEIKQAIVVLAGSPGGKRRGHQTAAQFERGSDDDQESWQ
jgi:hypothetical protein